MNKEFNEIIIGAKITSFCWIIIGLYLIFR